MTAGTNTAQTLSAILCTSGLDIWAFSTMRIICESMEFSPAAVASISRNPSMLMEPAVIRSPRPFAAGTLSPVIKASSTSASPRAIMPSTAMRSPGRHTTISPGFTRAALISRVDPSLRRTVAFFGRRASNSWMAAAALLLARASRCFPIKINVMMNADASK